MCTLTFYIITISNPNVDKRAFIWECSITIKIIYLDEKSRKMSLLGFNMSGYIWYLTKDKGRSFQKEQK